MSATPDECLIEVVDQPKAGSNGGASSKRVGDMSGILKFGFGEIHLGPRRLLVDGAAVPLGGRGFDLMVTLVAQPGRAFNKRELLDLVWGGATVEDANLHVQISKLRKYLGAERIRTVPRRGYVFVPTLEDRTSSSPPQGPMINGSQSASTLFGRDHDIDAVATLLHAHRLVVVTGAGGIGKTRLAQAVLEREAAVRRDGVAWIDLSTADAPAKVPELMARALQIGLGAASPPDALALSVRALEVTVLLDNVDVLVDALDLLLARLLHGAPRLRLLVTSQVPMKASRARHYRLDGLVCPAPAAPLAQALRAPALALLDDRIQAADGRFRLREEDLEDAVAICAGLEGIPLAIELAAVRCATLGLSSVREQLVQRLQWRRDGNAPEPGRRRTPREVMAWSYSLLGAAQQRAFRRLGVCVGGFGRLLASRLLANGREDELHGVDRLRELIGHSLVYADRDHADHFRLLDTARLYALELLRESGEEDRVRRDHAAVVTEMFEASWVDHWKLTEGEYVARFEPELENLRTALDWALGREASWAIALAGSAGPLWRCLSLQHEALPLFERAAALVGPLTPVAQEARLMEALAQQHDSPFSIEAREAIRRAAALYGQLHDAAGRYRALALLVHSYRYSRSAEANQAYEEMGRLENPHWPASQRLYGARVTAKPPNTELTGMLDFRAANELRLALAAQAGSDLEANNALINLADLALAEGDPTRAIRLNRALLDRLSRRELATRIIVAGNLLEALVLDGKLDMARTAGQELLPWIRQMDYRFGLHALDPLALLAALDQRWGAACHALGFLDHHYQASRRSRGANELTIRARLWALLESSLPAETRMQWLRRGSTMAADAVLALVLTESVELLPAG